MMIKTAGTATGRAVGARVPLIDGIEKVIGKADFTADILSVDTLVGRVLRSPVSHGTIVRIDTTKAEALPGVVAVSSSHTRHHTPYNRSITTTIGSSAAWRSR